MKQRLKHHLWKAVSEVGVSIIGSVGIIFVVSWLISLGPQPKSGWVVFASYFDGGEIGLSIFSLSGVIYLLISRLERKHEGLNLVAFVFLFAPVLIVAFVVGQNPGFEPTKIGTGQLITLWSLYALVHVVWFVLLLVQPLPLIPTPEAASKEQQKRTGGIEQRAQNRV